MKKIDGPEKRGEKDKIVRRNGRVYVIKRKNRRKDKKEE